ncbi:myomegalin-like isoform X4 [Conger conger]|uniref:myomegalin-like isoform X4 n=1 Tax=Conger conger TaxID=82655 RepID=UPI002A5AFF36|nr:myomegalin-like isoform X4 [Conger conger]
MKEACRICARELLGNQRRWIFHPASKHDLRALLSYALGQELARDGRGEFACSKCVFMLTRMYRFDTVIARVEALSIAHIWGLLMEKDRLRHCIRGLYRRSNSDEPGVRPGARADCTLPEAKYSALLQKDCAYSMYESWAEHEYQTLEGTNSLGLHPYLLRVSTNNGSRSCRKCNRLRVADSDYEAVCKVPRKVARSVSCRPTGHLASTPASRCGEPPVAAAAMPMGSPPVYPESTVQSLDIGIDDSREDQCCDSSCEEHACLALALRLARECTYRPVPRLPGSRLPILCKPASPGPGGTGTISSPLFETSNFKELDKSFSQKQPASDLEMLDLEQLWQDAHAEYLPFRQNLIEEQQAQLNQYECAAGQCVSELQKAQLQVQSLQAKIHESETNNKKLQEKLCEMESELRSIRQAAQCQERTIQGLSESVTTKDSEAEELYRVIEGQNDTLCKLREMAQRSQLQQMQGLEMWQEAGQTPAFGAEFLALQNSLFSTKLELEGSQRARRQMERQAADHIRARDRLHADLQEALQTLEKTEKHNQEMRCALQQTRCDLQVKEGQVKEKEGEREMEVEEREKTIRQLRISLKDKDHLLEEYSELMDRSRDPSESRDALLDKLRGRIKERDKALERSIDDKFHCLEEKEEEVRQLQLSIREKDRDMDRLRCVLSNNEDTITSLDRMVRGKDLELEQVSEAYRKLQWLKQEAEECQGRSLRERDAIIGQLQNSLQMGTKELEELTASLVSKVSADPSELVEKLRLHLQLKEHLFKEVLSDRSQQAQEHSTEVQELLSTIGARDQYIKESASQLRRVISERTDELQEVRKQLIAQDREVRELKLESEQRDREPRLELELLQSQLREKEALIQLVQEREEPMVIATYEETPKAGDTTPRRQEVEAVEEELKLVLKKEKEAQLEVSTLHSTLTRQEEEVCSLSAQVEALTASIHAKEDLIKDMQKRLVDPSDLPLVEELTNELQALRESRAQQDTTSNDYQQRLLEQLVLEYSSLNAALRTEMKLYHSLTQIHAQGQGSGNTLQTELNTVQALRGQLEEVLARTQNVVLAVETSPNPQPDFGELNTDEEGEEEEEEEEEEEDGSSEYSDSIEEEDSKLTARTLATTMDSGVICKLEDPCPGLEKKVLSQSAAVDGRGLAEWRVEMQQLMEQKRAVERELGELKVQLEKAGFASLSQMRIALLNLQQENSELKQAAGHVTWRGWEQGVTSGLSSVNGGGVTVAIGNDRGVPGPDAPGAGEEVGPAQGKRGAPKVPLQDGQGKRRCTRPPSQDRGGLPSPSPTHPSHAQDEEPGRRRCEVREQVEVGLRSELALSRQESRDLQERLMVSEATVQAQAEQLKDYRELLTETSVEQASKQVQVDLQDLGYETCGRSENEAEREDTSSPEFDDLEMCTSLSGQQVRGTRWWGAGGAGAGCGGEEEDAETLRRHVRDLRAQLSRSTKVVRNLQARVRSLSATSDYASSLERPRKVNWSFQPSPSHSAADEDEGWQSDGPGHVPEPRPNRTLRELVSRVASLEAQLKSSKLEGKSIVEDPKSATWPGKYNTLIQAQARELSHLRQAMREGRGVCHILSQHLGDTTKAFEELLRANDIDYYMGQSFRQQLAQSSALADRVGTKISGWDRTELHEDKMGHELLALRLSKELQQKDKIIETLHTKLQQHADTPSSGHALSETTDQSDRTSFVSDEQGSTNEDLELCSDIDGPSEYVPEERSVRGGHMRLGADPPPKNGTPSQHIAIPSPTTASHGVQSSASCPSILCTPHNPVKTQVHEGLYSGTVSSSLPAPLTRYCPDLTPFDPHSPLMGPGGLSLGDIHQELQTLQKELGESFGVPHIKALSDLPPDTLSYPEPSAYLPLSQHAFHQPQLGSSDRTSTPKLDVGVLENNALWEAPHASLPVRVGAYGTISSGSSGYRSGASYTGADLIEEHLREIRGLRQQLEESVRTNERLRQQLEDRLASVGRESRASTNIYIQGIESLSQLTNENRALKEEILALQSRLQASRDSCKEVEHLREEVLMGRAQLKESELEVEEWREEVRRLQAHSCQQGQEIQQLKQERQTGQEHNNRLHHEVNLLQQQLAESRRLLHSLQCELQVYDRMCRNGKNPYAGYRGELTYSGVPSSQELGELLVEVRALRAQLERSVQENGALRVQLEQQLGGAIAVTNSNRRPNTIPVSPQRDGLYKRQLFHDPAPSPPVRDTGLFNSVSPYAPLTGLEDPQLTVNDALDPHADLEGEAPDGSFANRNGRHAVGHVDDFTALQQQVLEGKALVHKMKGELLDLDLGGAPDYGGVTDLLADAKTLQQILEEATSLLKMFWRAALPDGERFSQHIQKEKALQEEVHKLKLQVTKQEEVLEGTVERLRNSNRTKEGMERFIISQLSRTRDVLKKARSNLQKNESKISSLSSSSSSTSPYPAKAEVLRGPGEQPPDRSIMSPRPRVPARGVTSQRPARKRGGQCLLQVVTH